MRTILSLLCVVPAALLLSACSGGDADTTEAGCDLSASNSICTIAGSGEVGYDSNADTHALDALKAEFSLPQDTLTASNGSIYILDWNNHRIRLLKGGKVSWVAGRGELGGSLDDPANGDFNHPTNIIFDETTQKIMIAAWHNSKVRILDRATGAITDNCGDGKRAYWGDEGPAAMASLDLPASLAWAPTGDLVIMDQANQVLRNVDANGNIHRMAGRCIIDSAPPAGPGKCPDGVEPTQCPPGMDMRPSGKYTCGDPMLFCSKPCTPGYAGDELPADQMRMAQPFGQSASPAGRIIYDNDGNLYFADTANSLIRMIDTDGIVHRIAGLAPENGSVQSGYSGDGGLAINAKLNYPVDLAFGDDGTLFFTDVHNHCVRSIDTHGKIHTVVGVCTEKGFDGDNGPPSEAHLNLPFGIEWSKGRLLVSDTGNSRIRAVRLP
ncbi:MAG TPA: hypothetical protein VL137_02470 [Polyangiaceae bacterium]|nr:hypothetical protein [Polyangiaceae bacterium]